MAGTCIQTIITQKGSSDGMGTSAASASVTTSNSTVSSAEPGSTVSAAAGRNSGTSGTGSNRSILTKFTDAVGGAADKIESAAGEINGTDCSAVLAEWLKSMLPSAVSTVSGKIYDTMFVISHCNYVGKAKSAVFTKQVCAFLADWSAVIDQYMNIIMKAAFVWFAKIDEARRRLQLALIDFNEAVRNCIKSVVRDAVKRLDGLIGATLGIDWNELIDTMDACPCMTKWMAMLTGCKTDADGNDISDDADAVVACIKDKNILLRPDEIKAKLNAWVDLRIRENIDNVFDSIRKVIDNVFAVIIRPLRNLIKAYAKALMYKVDVTKFIKALGYAECFFTYTTEYRGGKKIYGMSAVDMVNTMRSWTVCFANLCPTFSADMANKVRKINEDLRLDDSFWRRALETDIYSMCIAAGAGTGTTRDTVTRSLYASDDAGVTPFKGVLDAVSAAPDIDLGADRSDASAGTMDMAVTFVNAPDTENEVNVGDEPISRQDESVLVSMGSALSAKSDNGYFLEKFYQLLRFMEQFAMDDATVSSLEKMKTSAGAAGTPLTSPVPKTQFTEVTSRQENLDAEEDRSDNYHVESDYDADSVSAILSARVTVGDAASMEGELEALYAGASV